MSNKNTQAKPLIKPLLRGYLHQFAFFISLIAGVFLIYNSSNKTSLISSLIFILGLLLLFGISALYHRIHWQPKPRALMKRLDHSAIFVLIASTFTPICLLALSEKNGFFLLLVVWISAVAGIFQSVFWVSAPKYVTALFYVIMGWLAAPYIGELKQTLGINQLSLLITGGVFYTVGAIFYAFKKPNIIPHIFGYHELFHLFTIIAASLHFLVIFELIK